MDGLRDFLDAVRQHRLVAGHLRGLFHIAIGRRISTADGAVVSTGATWRELSNLLKLGRFDKELVREIGGDPDDLAPRDRQRFWYSAIALARPDSAEARAEADRLAVAVRAVGYVIGPPPTGRPSTSHPPSPKPAPPPAEDAPKKATKKGDEGGTPKKKKK